MAEFDYIEGLIDGFDPAFDNSIWRHCCNQFSGVQATKNADEGKILLSAVMALDEHTIPLWRSILLTSLNKPNLITFGKINSANNTRMDLSSNDLKRLLGKCIDQGFTSLDEKIIPDTAKTVIEKFPFLRISEAEFIHKYTIAYIDPESAIEGKARLLIIPTENLQFSSEIKRLKNFFCKHSIIR